MIQNTDDSFFELIKTYIQNFELDNRELSKEEFLVATSNHELVGFGRIRQRDNCSELCSLGVIEPERLKGVGKQLVQALIQKATEPLYLVCIIPTFFESFGFYIVDEFPEAMQEKLNYCTSELIVPEKYVVMKYKKELK
jgi:N-acetylglutamate synthase-like GNAT family acetyltransferase